MKELTEQEKDQLKKDLEYFSERSNQETIELSRQEMKYLLSLLSKDQTMTKEEMNQAIEEAKNEDSSPEITSAFEPVVGAEELKKQTKNLSKAAMQWKNQH